MPDYSKSPQIYTEQKFFRDWLKEKGYAWPPTTIAQQDALVCQFQREMMERYAHQTTCESP